MAMDTDHYGRISARARLIKISGATPTHPQAKMMKACASHPSHPLPGFLPVALALVLTPAFAAPVAGDALVDAELSRVQVTCAKPGEAGETKIEFLLRSKEPGWVLSETPGAACAATNDDESILPYRVTCGPAEDDGSLHLEFQANRAPDTSRIKLDKTLFLTRSKKGRSLPSHTVEANTEGNIEIGGIPFHYKWTPGNFQVKEGGMSLTHGSLTLSYPENVRMASLTVASEEGLLLSEERRSPGMASFSTFARALSGETFTIQATLSAGDEQFELPFHKELTLDGVVGERRKSRGKPIPDVSAAYRADALEALASSSATCEAEVRLRRMTLMERDENERPYLTLDLEVGGSEGRQLFMKGPNQQVTARDAEGNVLTGYYFSVYTDGGRNRPLNVALSFYDHLPAGGWIELDSGLRLYRAKGMRTLAPQPLSLGGRGRLQAEGLHIDYRPSMPFWSNDVAEPGKEMRALTLTFPDDGHIVGIDLCDRHGRPLTVNFAWYDEDGKNITCAYTFMVDAGEQGVQAVVTAWDGAEPCVIPLKMKIGLNGSLRQEGDIAAPKAPLPPNQAE